MQKPANRMKKGDIALVQFDSSITRADCSTSRKTYYKFCVITRTNRQGVVITVQRKGDNHHAPVTGDCFYVPADKCAGVNPVHFLGNEDFKTPNDAASALLALIAAATGEAATSEAEAAQ